MGYALSWVAIKGRSTEELRKILGFKATGKHDNYGEHALVGRQLPNGWYILIANACDDRITKSKLLTELSKGCQVVACSIEEHVMFSSCACWNKGKKVWSVRHNGDRGTFDIVSSGKLPENYSSLKHELIEKQKTEGGENAEVDYVFELPLQMAKQLVEFKHDEEMDQVDRSYEIYEFNLFQRVCRAISASFIWLYIGGFLLFIVVFWVAMSELGRWIEKVIKGIVP
jgi:hypothetical protein